MSAAPTAPDRTTGLPRASLGESLAFLVVALLPAVLGGLFSPRARVHSWLSRVDASRRVITLMSGLRHRHPGQGVRLLGGRIVALWDPATIGEVLDHSADTYASDAGAKGKGMAHFMPDALTLSRGDAWRDRRAFTEEVLAPDQRRHPHADRFVAVVGEEVARLATGDELRWSAWEQLFDRITLRVIFGDRALEEPELTGDLEALMAEANRLVGLSRSDRFYELYGRIERRLQQPEKGSLLSCTADAPATDTTRVVHQVPHWMFAMRDTLAANTYRALAVVVADRRLSRLVEEEASGLDLDDPVAVDGLEVLGRCLEEAMRLWPTTPLLTRETTRETELAGVRLPAGTQIMIVNTFTHRDREDVPDADLVVPERWEHVGGDGARYNHLSNGTQDCPGAPLVRLLGKAVLARTLGSYDLTLRRPRLRPEHPMPASLDAFGIRFGVRPRA